MDGIEPDDKLALLTTSLLLCLDLKEEHVFAHTWLLVEITCVLALVQREITARLRG